MCVTHRFEIRTQHHPECTKRIIIGILRMVTEAYESHRLLADFNNNKDLLKTRLVFILYAQISLKTIGIISYCWTLIPFIEGIEKLTSQTCWHILIICLIWRKKLIFFESNMFLVSNQIMNILKQMMLFAFLILVTLPP